MGDRRLRRWALFTFDLLSSRPESMASSVANVNNSSEKLQPSSHYITCTVLQSFHPTVTAPYRRSIYLPLPPRNAATSVWCGVRNY